MLATFILYALATTAFYYLGALAKITSWLWSRYPNWLDSLARCAACSGFWYGLILGGVGAWQDWPFLGLPGRSVLTVVLVGLGSLVWTPLLAFIHIRAVSQTTLEPYDDPESDDGQEG